MCVPALEHLIRPLEMLKKALMNEKHRGIIHGKEDCDLSSPSYNNKQAGLSLSHCCPGQDFTSKPAKKR